MEGENSTSGPQPYQPYEGGDYHLSPYLCCSLGPGAHHLSAGWIIDNTEALRDSSHRWCETTSMVVLKPFNGQVSSARVFEAHGKTHNSISSIFRVY